MSVLFSEIPKTAKFPASEVFKISRGGASIQHNSTFETICVDIMLC